MRRISAIAIVTFGALPVVGCGPDVPESGPAVTVALWDDARGCYARCEGTPALDPDVAAAAGQSCSEPEGASGRACALRQGDDRVRLIADYGAVTVTSCADVALPTLTEILDDDDGQRVIDGLSPGCVERQRYFAQKTLTAPVTASRTVRFRVASSTSYFTDTPSFTLARPRVELSVARCLDAMGEPVTDCSMVAGVDRTLVTIAVPAGVADDLATLGFGAEGALLQSQLVTLSPSEGRKIGSYELVAPDAPGKRLTVAAQVGDLASVSQSIALVAPAPLAVQIAGPDAPLDFVSPPPAIAAGDPTKECRTFALGVLAPTGAPGDAVMVKTSQGTLDDSADPVTLLLHAAPSGSGRTASATLSLPAAPAGPLVQIAASAGGSLITSVQLQLLPILPVAAQLATVKKTIPVDAGGSAAAAVSGFAIAPSGASFLDGARVYVVTKATPASGPVSLACGAPSPAGDLDCDATTPGQLPGGCLLGPTSVPIGVDGSISIPLAAGICFAGTVTVDVYAVTYASNETCLGDRQRTAAPVRLTSGPALALTYGP